MLYTVTLNPSLDYTVTVNDFQTGLTNRAQSESITPGGKGINVSMVLKNLGIENTALGFVAGFTGDEIRRTLEEKGIDARFVRLNHGTSRINVKIKNMDGTEINGIGPAISEEEIQILLDQLEQMESGDILVLAGSIPQSVSNNIYRSIMEKLMGRQILTAVDATGDLLRNVLQYHPFLIKPNNHELGDLFGVVISSREEVIPYAKRLQQEGARNVLVSMAGQGAVLLDETGHIHMAEVPTGKLVNAVGAGDSMVAGFLAGWLEKKDYSHAFRMGVAAGSASAFSESLATGEEIAQVYERCHIW